MATGGSGDVLTGILLALLAQGYDADSAAKIGVYIHGLAGDEAANQMGQIAMTASDIISYLPQAWKTIFGK
jgi:NAD(P)H-hydrate epimerase